MKITKFIELGPTEMEVEITADDIRVIFFEDEAESVRVFLREIDSIAQFLRAVPDIVIQSLGDGQRKSVCVFLQEQAERFK